jgi:hypothetical protein
MQEFKKKREIACVFKFLNVKDYLNDTGGKRT